MVTTTKFTIKRNGQVVEFAHHAGTVGEDLPDFEQVGEYKYTSGATKPKRDFLIDGVHVLAGDQWLARQAIREWATWGAEIQAQQEAQQEARYDAEGRPPLREEPPAPHDDEYAPRTWDVDPNCRCGKHTLMSTDPKTWPV